nr:hypothetical protein GCM10020093_031970 [Planobispora longispora]
MVSVSTRPRSARMRRGEVRLQQRAHPPMVGLLGVEVTQRAAEQRRLSRAGGALGFAVGAAETVVVQQTAHLLVSGHQPGRVAERGADGVDGAAGLQVAQQSRGPQG